MPPIGGVGEPGEPRRNPARLTQDQIDFEVLPDPPGDMYDDTGSDKALAGILDQQGFGRPREVSATRFDAAVAAGAKPIYRGLGDAASYRAYRENFMTTGGSDIYVGRGIFGDGYYFSTDEATANEYADFSEKYLTAALDPDARVINSTDLPSLTDRAVPGMNAKTVSILSDDGRFAAANGYDAIRVGSVGPDEDYYVVLNRSALIVREEDDVHT